MLILLETREDMMNTVIRAVGSACATLGLLVACPSTAQRAVQAFEISPATYTVRFDLPAGIAERYRAQLSPSKVKGTLRYRFAVTAGGRQLRLRLSNELGQAPLRIGGASLALAASGMSAEPGTMRAVTFSGRREVIVLPGSPIISDPIDLPVGAMSELVASVYLPEEVAMSPLGGASMVRMDGDATTDEKFSGAQTVVGRPISTGLLLEPSRSITTIVAFGDSITDGARSVPTQPHGWADALARRLNGSRRKTAVVSAGIGGNRMLSDGWGPSALARADRDVFSVPGVTHVVLLEGINDIGMAGAGVMGREPDLDVEHLLQGYEQVAARAHARGLKIYIGTLTPFRGAPYFTQDKERQRLAVNDWIRRTRLFDGVIDFEAALKDRTSGDRLASRFDSGDHLHPSEAGYQAMAAAIPLALFSH